MNRHIEERLLRYSRIYKVVLIAGCCGRCLLVSMDRFDYGCSTMRILKKFPVGVTTVAFASPLPSNPVTSLVVTPGVHASAR